MDSVAEQLHPGVIGGLPTDTFSNQVLRVATYAESYLRGTGESVCGISLDASKCFDRIDWCQIATLACEQGVPHGIVRAVLGYYVSHKRYSSLGGQLDSESWVLSRGLLQGCALSVSFTLSLVSRWHFALGAGVKSLSFVDDRIILARESDQLLESWEQSQQWDAAHGWKVNIKKTSVFAIGQPTPEVVVGDESLARPKVFRYLGSEIHLAHLQVRTVIKARVETAFATLRRIGQLPAAIGINALLRTVETTAMPQLTYGFHAREIPQMVLRQLAAAVRRAVWRGRKRMHSWVSVCLFCYSYHRVHPPAAAVYAHVLAVVRALRTMDGDTLADIIPLFRAPLLPKAVGPMQVFLTQMRKLGFMEGDSWDSWTWQHKQLSLLHTPLKELAHYLRMSVRQLGLAQLATMRRCMIDVATADIEVTARLFRSGGQGMTSESVTLIGDGLWHASRRYKAGRSDTPECPLCGIPEDTHHVLWVCPRWSAERGRVPEVCLVEAQGSDSARLCGICHQHFSAETKKAWPAFQLALCGIIHRYQEEMALQKRHRVGGSGGALRCLESPLPRQQILVDEVCRYDDLWPHAHPVPASAMLTREQNGARWPFSEQALSQLLWYLRLLRIAPSGSSISPVSVLELYFGFLYHNGENRFLSGVSDSNAGDHLAVQVDKFVKGIQAWQNMTRTLILIPHRRDRVRVDVRWQIEYGYPPSPALEVHVLMPQWGDVRKYMISEAGRLSPHGGLNTDESRPWRRWAPGIPESQTDLKGGQLPVYSPLWAPVRRIRGRVRLSRMDEERLRVAPMVRFLQAHPAGQQHLNGHPLWHTWRTARLVTRDQLQQHRRSLGLLGRKIDRLLLHTEGVLGGALCHVTAVCHDNMRAQCAACGQCAPMHGLWRWLRKPCSKEAPVHCRAVMRSLRSQAEQAQQQLQATALVLRDL